MKLGYGESLARMMTNDKFRRQVISFVRKGDSPTEFTHRDYSLLSTCSQRNIPFTVHAGIGTDMPHQHPDFSGEAIGGCSARDFLIFVNEVAAMQNGGVIINIASATIGPNLLINAINMATNAGKSPKGVTIANLDLRPYILPWPSSMPITDESVRENGEPVEFPFNNDNSFFFIRGNIQLTVPHLYRKIRDYSQTENEHETD